MCATKKRGSLGSSRHRVHALTAAGRLKPPMSRLSGSSASCPCASTSSESTFVPSALAVFNSPIITSLFESEIS
ncbi:uncharacterized protein DS421_11g351190 [Arachis hypogaea]|nr:uncharacterized protein DS421_11g351190 [Arachis hypogaea]